MNVGKAIETRRSIRKYKSVPIEPEKLKAVTEAFRLAPSAKNLQNWKLYVVTDPEKKRMLWEASPGKQTMLTEAPAVLVATGSSQGVMTSGHRVDSIDLSIAMSFSMLAAWEQGLGTCWMANYTEDGVRKALGLPDDISIAAIMPIGYADEEVEARPRKDETEVIEII